MCVVNKNWNSLTYTVSRWKSQELKITKIFPAGVALANADRRRDGRTDIIRPIVDFRSRLLPARLNEKMPRIDTSNNTRNFETSEEWLLIALGLWPYLILATSELVGWMTSAVVPVCICCLKFLYQAHVNFVNWFQWYVIHCCWREIKNFLVCCLLCGLYFVTPG
jgi:hypothetical protein